MTNCIVRGCAAEPTHFHLVSITGEDVTLIAVCLEHRSLYISDEKMKQKGVPVLTREEAEVWLIHQA
jgi:hypothetical protein